jgi:ABC-type nitrate/sulfonate/bicarbonate transport system substrate-binding protein
VRLLRASFLAVLLWPAFAQAADPLIAVDVALGDVTINKVPFLMAADTGIYARNGLAVRQFVTPEAAETARQSGVVVPAEMVRKDSDTAPVSIGGGSPAIYNAVHMGAPHYVVLATLESVLNSHIIAAPAIRTLDDLRGKRLGYSQPGRAAHIGLLSFARRIGWTPGRDITLVARVNTLADLTGGNADAIIAGGVLVALAPKAGLNDVVDLRSYNIPFAGSGVMAERRWLAANRGTATRFVRASVEALALMKRNRAAFDTSVGRWFNITDKAVLDRMYAEVADFPDKPYPSVDGIRLMMEVYDSPQMRMHMPSDFYDTRFMEELDRSGYLSALYR